MAKLIPVGIFINGRRRRFTIMPGGRYLYSPCPNCTSGYPIWGHRPNITFTFEGSQYDNSGVHLGC